MTPEMQQRRRSLYLKSLKDRGAAQHSSGREEVGLISSQHNVASAYCKIHSLGLHLPPGNAIGLVRGVISQR